MRISDRDIAADSLYFVVEEAQYNLGDFAKALLMIETAALTGADAIEFQLAYADDFYVRSHPGHALYKTREFSDAQLAELVDRSHSLGLHFIATCLSHRLVDKLARMGADAFNVNASDINNPDIVDAVTDTGRPFFVSLPLATMEEVEWATHRITDRRADADFALLHGQHPMASGHEHVHLEDTSLGVIRNLRNHFDRPVGFIDHTPLVNTPALAVAAGATVITKHLTPNHLVKGPDHQVCLNPEQMAEAVAIARKTYASLAVTQKAQAKGEDLDRTVMRRSVVSARAIAKGERIETADIRFKRPGTGIPPDRAGEVVGKTAATDIPEDHPIEPHMLQ